MKKRCLQFLMSTAVFYIRWKIWDIEKYEYVLRCQSLALIDLDEAAKSTISTLYLKST